MATIKKGDAVKFQRNALVKETSTMVSFSGTITGYTDPIIVIESPNFGWIPEKSRMDTFGLNKDKKYLFVAEKELTKI